MCDRIESFASFTVSLNFDFRSGGHITCLDIYSIAHIRPQSANKVTKAKETTFSVKYNGLPVDTATIEPSFEGAEHSPTVSSSPMAVASVVCSTGVSIETNMVIDTEHQSLNLSL